jgi:FkbM family methyltransferase
MQFSLERRANAGLKVNSVIDVGASNGSWSRKVKRYFPNASYFLIEANSFHEVELRQYKSQCKNVDYILAAAGDYDGEIYFNANDPFGGLASHSPMSSNNISVPVTKIDTQVKERSLLPPFLIKLDTHGFEVPILEGAIETLRQTELVVVESYNFQLTPDSLKFWELCNHMEDLGFRPIDISDPMHRPVDHAFWQADIFFIPLNSKEFLSNSYEL